MIFHAQRSTDCRISAAVGLPVTFLGWLFKRPPSFDQHQRCLWSMPSALPQDNLESHSLPSVLQISSGSVSSSLRTHEDVYGNRDTLAPATTNMEKRATSDAADNL